MKKIHCLLFLFFIQLSVYAQKIEVDRITDRILILNENYFRSVAIHTEKGVVLIDTREPLEKMEEVKQIVKQEFGTDTFCYIINTHGCPEHILGNRAFPNTPVIMNENFFNRKKIYGMQKKHVDSLEVVCNHTTDTALHNEICNRIEDSKNWRKDCIKALNIEPDITYSEKMNLCFDGLTIQMVLTGLGHGYSTFIYIPEEKFLHVSTLGSRWAIPKYTIPKYLDAAEFLPYQIKTIKDIINISDSLTFVVPSHGDYYAPDVLKQMLSYYTNMYDFAMESYSSKTDYDTYMSECNIIKLFAEYDLFKDLEDKEIQRHHENIDWLWNYFKQYSVE